MTRPHITIGGIKRAVAVRYGVSVTDIVSARRTRRVTWPRRIGMYLAKTLTPHSLVTIGAQFGKRDHTTVLSAVDKAHLEVSTNEFLAEEVRDVTRDICAASMTILGRLLATPEIGALEDELNSMGLELVIMPLGTRDETGFPKKKMATHQTGENQ